MPPKEKPSKKAVKEKKERQIDDQTFGLKNKNKSAKVQQFISRVQTNVKNQNGGLEQAKAREMKKDTKLAKQLEEEQMRLLLGEGIANQSGKSKASAAADAERLGLNKGNEELEKIIEDMMSSDDDSSSDEEGQYGGRKRKTIYIEEDEHVATEVFREKTIEDIIEEQRQKLAASGKVGTPVNSETFAVWRAEKLARRQAEAEARVKAEQAKKKGGKGLSVLSGKELFNFNSSLFVDDDSAVNVEDERDMADYKRQQELEELRQAAELEQARREQERLAEAQELELRCRIQTEEQRLKASKNPKRPTFVLNGIIINQVVFEDEEVEDLSLFKEEKLVESFSAAIDERHFEEDEGKNASAAADDDN